MGCAPAAAAWRKRDLAEVSLDLQKCPFPTVSPGAALSKVALIPSDLGCLHLQELQVNLEIVTLVMQNCAKSWLYWRWEMQMRWQFLEAKFRHLSVEETQCYVPDPSRHAKECHHGQGTAGLSASTSPCGCSRTEGLQSWPHWELSDGGSSGCSRGEQKEIIAAARQRKSAISQRGKLEWHINVCRHANFFERQQE